MNQYQPLSSVWYGNDAELLEQVLNFYPRSPPETIIDTTFNKGRFWKGSERKIISVDIDPQYNPDFVCNNSDMPFLDSYADVLIYDPPHLTDCDTQNSSKIWKDRFGLTSNFKGDNICSTFDPFMKEASRVLKPEGMLFCKITDGVHNHRFQWNHIDLIESGKKFGFTACDCIIKARKVSMTSSKWQKAHHARRYHCYWIIFRKSNRCE